MDGTESASYEDLLGFKFDPNDPTKLITTYQDFHQQVAGVRGCFLLRGELKVLEGDGKTPETAYKLGV